MEQSETQSSKIRKALSDGRAVRWSELAATGASRRAVMSMMNTGELIRCGRDVYKLGSAAPRRFAHWDEIAAKYPSYAIVLISAAQHHGLTTQMAMQTWVALPTGSKPSNPSLRCLQWPLHDASGSPHRCWTVGMDSVEADGSSYPVTGAARTVVDLWLWRNRMPDGERIFLEAINEYDAKGLDRAELRSVARVFGVDEALSGLLRARSEFTSGF